MPKFNGNEAMFEHMLEGHPISLPEAILMFGVQGPNRALYQFKERGYIIKSRKVSSTCPTDQSISSITSPYKPRKL